MEMLSTAILINTIPN